MADHDLLLTDLCKICNSNEPKYCCPRCKSRTCSLDCYKRHKLWSQCSGKRDPGAYVKRSQLATAAGIDHDYNFLTGIEKAFGTAERDADDRGISLRGSSTREPVSGSNFDKNLRASGVIVHRAPKGMSRQRDNHTRWNTKQKCINWSVEWINPDLSKQLGICRENVTLAAAYSSANGTAHQAKKRKLSTEQTSEKTTRLKGPETQTPVSRNTGDTSVKSETLNPTERPSIVDPSELLETALNVDEPPKQTDASSPSDSLHFYLSKPHTSSSTRVLVPLKPTDTFAKCLYGQVVLEFPTIQVLKHPPTALPTGFKLEREYVEETRKTIQELDEELGDVSAYAEATATAARPTKGEDEAFHETKVMESLQRDIDIVWSHVK